MQFFVLRTSAFCVGNEPVNHKRPVHVRHPAIRGAPGQTEQRTLYLGRRGFALCGPIEPFHKGVVSGGINWAPGSYPAALGRRRRGRYLHRLRSRHCWAITRQIQLSMFSRTSWATHSERTMLAATPLQTTPRQSSHGRSAAGQR
jgi:hypothetical protein